MKTELYYFTGTGNGLYVAKSIKSKLEDMNQEVEMIPINTLNLSEKIVSQASKVGIIYPTYGMTSPDIVKKFAKKIVIDNGAYVFLFAHSGGGGAGVALNSIKMILHDKGIEISNTFEAKFPSNSAIRPYKNDEVKKILDKSKNIVDESVRDIVRDEKREIRKVSMLKKSAVSIAEHVAGAGEKILKFKEISVDETCISCSTCVKVCPVNNIELIDGKPVFGDKCEMCMSCVNQCPKKSLSYGKMKKSNMISYRHPDISLKEMMYR